MPEGSKVVIVEDVPTSSGLTSEEAYSFLAPATEMSYTLTGVSANRTHLYTAELYNGAGERIGTSIEKIQASVDDNSINFTINSTATALEVIRAYMAWSGLTLLAAGLLRESLSWVGALFGIFIIIWFGSSDGEHAPWNWAQAPSRSVQPQKNRREI